MIAQLTGTIVERGLEEAIVEVAGIGYRVHMPALSLAALPPVGEEARIRTYLHVTDSGIALFGFASLEEEVLFKQLIGVSGIGPKIALAALSTYAPAQLIAAITAQDASAIAKVPGVGKKMASRIALELKDLYPADAALTSPVSAAAPGTDMGDIRDALLSFGFTTQEIDLALADAPAGLAEGELITYALKRLGSA